MHLSSEAIIDLIEGRGDPSHAQECGECGQRLAEWKQLHSRLRKTHLENAPATLLGAAYAIVEPGPKLGQKLSQKISQMFASVVFDSFTQPAFAGARGAGAARQVVLRAAEFDIHVKISGKPQSRQITGQILTRGEQGFVDAASVHLLHDGTRMQSALLDPLGEFEFAKAPEGLLSLQIDLPNLTVIGTLGNEEAA